MRLAPLAALLLLLVALAPAAHAARPLLGAVIVVDPGHNRGNASNPQSQRPVDYGAGSKPCDATGTSTNDGYPEYAFTWDVSRRVAAILRARGARVILTRGATTPAWGPCITERAAIGNRARADAAISIHGDGGPPGVSGFFTIATATPIPQIGKTAAMIAADVELAAAVRDAYGRSTGMRVSPTYGGTGIYRSNDYGGTNLSRVPKIFIECGNMRNAGDAARLRDARFRGRAAAGIAAGLERFVLARR